MANRYRATRAPHSVCRRTSVTCGHDALGWRSAPPLRTRMHDHAVPGAARCAAPRRGAQPPPDCGRGLRTAPSGDRQRPSPRRTCRSPEPLDAGGRGVRAGAPRCRPRRGARGRPARAVQRGDQGRYDRCQGEAAPSICPDCNTRLYVYMRGMHDGDSTWPRMAPRDSLHAPASSVGLALYAPLPITPSRSGGPLTHRHKMHHSTERTEGPR